jgi:hypothetical protein
MITTLILGAGASHAYGYPTGSQLLQKVKEVLAKETIGPNANLARNFDHLGIESLDAYMNLNQDAGPILKRIIGEIIHSCEDDSALNLNAAESPYALFMQAIPPENFENFRIVTFNYDRSLQYFLARWIIARKGCNAPEAFQFLKKLKIIPVHGRLSNLPGETGFENQYAQQDMPYGHYNEMHARLKRLPPGQQAPWARDNLESSIHIHAQQQLKNCFENSDVCESAKTAIEESERVCFMGFGFHTTNMRALGYHFSQTGDRRKRIYGTTWELPGNEARRVNAHYPEIRLIKNCTAARLLRDYIVLDDPSLDSHG